MDTAALASSIQQANVGTQVAYAVARKTLDAQQQQGDAALQLLQAAAEIQAGAAKGPNAFGGSLDIQG